MAMIPNASSRKARRKEERRVRKKHKTTAFAKETEDTGGSSQERAKRLKAPNRNEQKPARRQAPSNDDKASSTSDVQYENHRKTSKNDLYGHLDEATAAALRRDDEEIAALEAKLGLASDKDKSRLHREYAKLERFGDDFGEFLDDLDHLADRMSQSNTRPVHNALEDDADANPSSEDEEIVPMKEPLYDIDQDDNTVDELESLEEETIESDESEGEQEVSDDESRGDDDSDQDEEEIEPDHSVKDTYQPTRGEDIYGNKIDGPTSKQSTTKYLPPHLRKKQQDDNDDDDVDNANREESRRELRRALNNSLNRLSEDTLISVAQSITKLYPSYPTPDVNQAIWSNMMNACIACPIVMAGMIPVYVGCLVGVHLQTSDNVQLGGVLLEQVITNLWQQLAKARSNDNVTSLNPLTDEAPTDKEACNLALVLCYLFNFGVAHCTLMYDVVRTLIHHFTETDVELLLIILSHCGHALRSDDPSALKDIVLSVQKKSLNDGASQSSRVEYMVSAMTDLKNNKKRRRDQAFGEKTAKLRKILGRIKSNAAAQGIGRSSDACLRIALQDILNAESTGRWWKVGACWVGNQYKHKTDDDNGDPENEDAQAGAPRSNVKGNLGSTDEEEELLKLASKYRMNTDVRRSIFCIIMGSADCDDAFEKLVRAGMLKNRTERDTVRVLMECCGNEKYFNSFYAYLASRICDYQPQCKFTFQLAFWDTFKQFEQVKLRKAANLAKLLYHLVAIHDTLRLNVLKVIDTSPDSMSESASIFLTIFFSSIFEHFENPADVVRLFPQGRPDVAMGSSVDSDMTAEGNSEALRESLSVFFLQTLKSSPKNKKKSRFRANLKAAVKSCGTDYI